MKIMSMNVIQTDDKNEVVYALCEDGIIYRGLYAPHLRTVIWKALEAPEMKKESDDFQPRCI